MVDPGDRAERGAGRGGDRGLGDRPRRADRPARRRPALPHPGAGDPPQPRRDPADLPRPHGGRGSAGAGRSHRRPGRARVGGAAAPAREVPARQDGGLRRELRGGRDRHPRGGRVGGQRADVPDPARGARLRRGHREDRAHVRRPRRVPAAAAALVDRRADEPLHLDVERGDARRRTAGGARRTPRQRPHPRARRRGRPAGAALHPLLCLPQRLPGLRAGRRPRLRVGLPGSDRRDPQPADAGSGGGPAGRLAAVCLVAVRRLLRGVPGQDRHPRRARGPARPGRRRAPRRVRRSWRRSR